MSIFQHLVELLSWYLFVLISAPTAFGIAVAIQYLRFIFLDNLKPDDEGQQILTIWITLMCLPAVMYFYYLISLWKRI
ncbi:MAG: hypothetical protein O3B35_04825 [Proteobacteria bacterium]|jgi:membrane protein DedA with SNARE-associated domain|nr:hypothetical protein [Pseudomonadota bacterium]